MLKFALILLFPGLVQAMVVGMDTRELIKAPTQLPYSAVGMVEAFDGKPCTGTLVANDLVLTAAHCLIRDQKIIPPTHIRYHAHFMFGASSGAMSEVMAIEVGPSVIPNKVSDWALLKLKKPLGEQFGILPTAAHRSKDLHQAFLRVPGYDSIHPISRSYGLSLLVNSMRGHLKAIDGSGMILHDVPTGPGVSGAPLLLEENGSWTIVGMNVAEIRKGVQCPVFNKRDCHNIAVPESSWRDSLIRLKL